MLSGRSIDHEFAGSIPELYETYLVPLIFEPYAVDLADRVAAIGTRRPVEWRQANAVELPFDDRSFDAVVCQFGVMFFPEKAKAFSEARRVLRPGGFLMFSVWDRIEENEFANTVTTALVSLFPMDPPGFLARTPHGYHGRATIEGDLAHGGFSTLPRITTVTARSRAASARIPAVAYCQGTPLRNEIEALDAARLGKATDVAADAITRRFGRAPVDAKIQAHVVEVENLADQASVRIRANRPEAR